MEGTTYRVEYRLDNQRKSQYVQIVEGYSVFEDIRKIIAVWECGSSSEERIARIEIITVGLVPR